MPPPHMRTQENTLWILYQPVPPCSSTTLRVNLVEARNAVHTSVPKASVTASAISATVAAAAAKTRQRPLAISTSGMQHAELRLVGEQPDQHAGEDRPAVELRQRRADQRGGEKAVVRPGRD